MLFLAAMERVTDGLKMLTAHEFPTRNRKIGRKKEERRKKGERRKKEGRKKVESVRSRRNGMLQ